MILEGKGKEADGPMGKDTGIILRQDLLNRHTWVYPDWKVSYGEWVRKGADKNDGSVGNSAAVTTGVHVSFRINVCLGITYSHCCCCC